MTDHTHDAKQKTAGERSDAESVFRTTRSESKHTCCPPQSETEHMSRSRHSETGRTFQSARSEPLRPNRVFRLGQVPLRLGFCLRAVLFSLALAWACNAFPVPAACAFAAAEAYPEAIGFVNDFAGVIPDAEESRISAIAAELEEKTSAELAVATIATTGGMDIHDYSVDLYMRWGIGKKEKDNGVLIVAAIEDRQLWIKPGYGLEGTVTDAFAHAIYRDVLRPAFRKGDYGKGLLAAVEIVATAVADAEGAKLGTIGTRRVLPRGDSGGGSGVAGPIIFLAVFVVLLVLMGVTRMSAGRRVAGSPFWTAGGFSGGLKGGGFGGGFGGFGGGGCGGGGAGGGW